MGIRSRGVCSIKEEQVCVGGTTGLFLGLVFCAAAAYGMFLFIFMFIMFCLFGLNVLFMF